MGALASARQTLAGRVGLVLALASPLSLWMASPWRWGAFAIALVLGAALYLRAWLDAHAQTLAHGLSRIASGNFEMRLPEAGPAHLRALARAVNLQAEQVRRYCDERRQEAVQETQELLQSLVTSIEKVAQEKAEQVEAQNLILQEKNRELERASRLKSEFLANMSHELRTPLTAVIGYSEMLREDIAGELNNEQREYVGDIHRAGKHLLAMINDILDLAKIEAGKMELQRERVDLTETAAEAQDIARALGMRKGVALEVTTEEGVFCSGDPQRLKQVAINLLSNAMKFTPKGGKVTFHVRRAADLPFAELVVSDTGIGIDPAHHGLIFDAFQQVDGSATREYQGTGLGLSLVKKFAVGMGGSVHVESRLGSGSTFTVRIPLWKSAEPRVKELAAS